MPWLEALQTNPALQRALITAAFLLLLLTLRGLTLSALRRAQLSAELRRRWIIVTRNALLLLLLFGVFAIWAPELRTLALSLVALAAAVVLATKELLMCVSGTVLRSSSRAIKLGDHVTVAGVRGEIIDIGILTTTLLELGPGARNHQRTGRAVVLPNSVWLSGPAINETFTSAYVLQTITVPLKLDERRSWEDLEARLLEAAQAECAEFLDEARRNLSAQGAA